MVQCGRPSRSSRAKSVRSSSRRTIMGKAIRESSVGRLVVNREKGLLLSVYVDDIKLAGKKQNMGQNFWKKTICENHVYWGSMIWKVMQRIAWSDIANWRTKEPSNCTKSQLHAFTTINSRKKKWDLTQNGQNFVLKIVLKCLYFARSGRPDILCSVNKFARAVTKWEYVTNAWLVRFQMYTTRVNLNNISCGKYCAAVQVGIVSGLWFCQRSWGLKNQFQVEFCACLEVIHLFPQVGCARSKRQFHTVQRNLKLFLLIAGLRMDEIPTLDLWDYCFWSVAFFFQAIKEIQWKCVGKLGAWHSIERTHREQS